jgi:putative FmdB family regulatory protein
MPIYEYYCRSCNIEFEKMTSVEQRDTIACPACGAGKTTRKVSLAAPAQMVATAGGCEQARNCESAHCCGGHCHLD